MLISKLNNSSSNSNSNSSNNSMNIRNDDTQFRMIEFEDFFYIYDDDDD